MSSNAVSAHQGIRVSLEELIALRDDAQQLLWRTSSKRCSTQHGLKQSKHQGRGIDFADTRVYQAGDDIRHIDWHATLRTDQVHTKLYHEEKERPIWLLVDHNPTMYFATRYAFKSVVAARAAALCAWAFAAQGERVGGLVFSGKRQLSVPPKDRLHAVLPLLKQLADSSEQAASPVDNHSLDHAFDFLLQRHLHGNLILIFSDFLAVATAFGNTIATISSKESMHCYLGARSPRENVASRRVLSRIGWTQDAYLKYL